MEKEQAMSSTESKPVKTSTTECEKSTLEEVGYMENELSFEHHLKTEDGAESTGMENEDF